MKSESLGTQVSGLNLDESNCAKGVCEIGWKPAPRSEHRAPAASRAQSVELEINGSAVEISSARGAYAKDIAGARLKQAHK